MAERESLVLTRDVNIITIPDDCPMPKGEYLIEDRNGAEIMLRAPGATMKTCRRLALVGPAVARARPAAPDQNLLRRTTGLA